MKRWSRRSCDAKYNLDRNCVMGEREPLSECEQFQRTRRLLESCELARFLIRDAGENVMRSFKSGRKVARRGAGRMSGCVDVTTPHEIFPRQCKRNPRDKNKIKTDKTMHSFSAYTSTYFFVHVLVYCFRATLCIGLFSPNFLVEWFPRLCASLQHWNVSIFAFCYLPGESSSSWRDYRHLRPASCAPSSSASSRRRL